MEAILTTVGSILTQGLAWVGEVGTTVTETPLLMLSFCIGFVGLGVGLFKRLFRG